MPQLLRRRLALLLLASALLAVTAHAQTPPAQPTPSNESRLSESPPAPVVVWNRTLAVFRAPLGTASPQQRAEAASGRLEASLDRLTPEAVSYSILDIGTAKGAVVLGGTEILLAILVGDLPQDGATTIDAAGAQVVSRLQALLRERADQRRWPALVRSLIQVVVATVAFLAVWILCRRTLLRLQSRIARVVSRRIRPVGIAGIDLGHFVLVLLGWLIRLTEFAVRMGAAYLWLTFVLSRFAYSRPWGQRLGEILVNSFTRMAAGVVDQLPNLVTLAIILFATRSVAAAIGAWFHAVERGTVPVAWLDPVAAKTARRLVVIGIWLFAITLAYPYLPGANSDAFKGVSVFVGLMVSLGSAGVVGQIVSGLFLTFNRAVRPGDIVKVGNVSGVVKDLGLLSLKLSTRTKEEVTIPNSVVVADAIRNFSRVDAGAVVLSTSVTIGYDTPWRQVRALLLLAAARSEGVLREPPPVVHETALTDFYVEYELTAYGAATISRPTILSSLHEEILDVFNEYGVQIMSPNFEAQPDKSVFVERSKWFSAPAAKDDARRADR